ncbi:MAG: hypothetical protein ABIG61_12575 [Planctomycetota bacterium]
MLHRDMHILHAFSVPCAGERLRIGGIIFGLVVLTAFACVLSFGPCAAGATLFFDDDFEGPAAGSPVEPAKWTQLNASQPICVTDNITPAQGTRSAHMSASAASRGIYSNTNVHRTSFWIKAWIYIDPGGCSVLAIWDGNSKVVATLYIQDVGGGQYSVWVSSGNGADWIVVSTPITGWEQWIFGVEISNAVTGEGFFSVYLNDDVLAEGIPFTPYSPAALPERLAMYTVSTPFHADDVQIYEGNPFNPPGSGVLYYEPKNLGQTSYSFSLDALAGMVVTVNDVTYEVGSSFSKPPGDTEYLGYSGTGNWTAQVTQISQSEYHIDANNTYYSLERTIRLLSNHISVEDRFTNLRSRPDDVTGIKFTNEIHITGDAGSTIAGNLISPYSINAPERPFVHVVKAGTSVGMIARDDVYRNHSICYGQYRTPEDYYGIGDENFALAPGADYTVKWELYPRNSTDYYDFINTVRKEWGTANITLEGLFGFVHQDAVYNGVALKNMTISQIRNWLQISGAKIVAFVFVADHRPGVEAFGMDWWAANAYKAEVYPLIDRIHQADPNVKVLPYFHMGLNHIEHQQSDANLIPCRVMLEDGTHKYLPGLGREDFKYYYATPTNYWGSAIGAVFDDMLAHFDGIYWDEFEFANTAVYMKDVPDWDGHSVRIEPVTNLVQNKLTTYCLVNRELTEDFQQRIFSTHDGIMYANWEPTTEASTARGIPCFLEYVQQYDYPRGHLNTPLGYGGGDVTSNAGIAQEAYQFLQYGLIFGVSRCLFISLTEESLLAGFFPITPVEIHPGYILGKEKIITTKSGYFGFGDAGRLQALVYGADGLLQQYSGATVTENGRTYRFLELDYGQIAIISSVICGPNNATILTADISGPAGIPDCYVDYYDFARFASEWLSCTDPADANCGPY